MIDYIDKIKPVIDQIFSIIIVVIAKGSPFISIVALIISLNNYFNSKCKIKLVIKSIYPVANEDFYGVYCELINNSSQPITIHSAKITNLKYCFCINEPTNISGDTFNFNNETITQNNYGLKIPCYLEPYESKITHFVFLLNEKVTITKKNKLMLYTSRKNIKFKLPVYKNSEEQNKKNNFIFKIKNILKRA